MAGKKKREKVVYVDDGSTIADMSGVRGGFSQPRRRESRPRASLKEQLRTYWAATKLMLLPTLIAAAGMLLIYVIAYAVFSLA